METQVNSLQKTARLAGVLFLLWILTGFYDMLIVSPAIFVKGDPAASAQHILTHELLFRSGIFSGLITSAIWVFLAMTFYQLFKSVNAQHARLLVALVIAQVPVAFITGAFRITALMILKGEVLPAFEVAQRQDLAMLFLKTNSYAELALELFWGLWLFPLAILVYRSNFIPRFLGVWLIVNGIVYVLLCWVSLVLPSYRNMVFTWGMPAMFGELILMLWLLILGIRVRKEHAAPSS